MKNLYLSTKNKLKLAVALVFLIGGLFSAEAQVRVGFTQRTSSYTPTKKIYNVKGNFTMAGNTLLSPQNYGDNTNNNGQNMLYVDMDGNGNTMNSSMATLTLPMENGGVEACSNIVYAGLYWTGKSSANTTFSVTKNVINGSQAVNNNYTINHNQNITNTNYSMSVTRGGSSGARYPIYTFTGNGNTYAFSFFNSGNPRVSLSVNGGTATNIPVTVAGSSTWTATLTTPYIITDGGANITINTLIRNSGLDQSTTNTQNDSDATVNVSGQVPTYASLTKNFDKRTISLKGPTSGSYSTFTAATNDIYYPSGSDDDIYTAYTEVTDYVRTNGVGQYWAADVALLEGNVGGTGYAGGWGMIIVYENSKMKYRDVTIFDGYAYVNSGNTSGFDLPVTGFNTVQTGNVGMKLGVMASEGDVNFTGDYFRVRKLGGPDYQTLDHGGSSATNFFNSAINAPGARMPMLNNNTAIDITMTDVPNAGNSVIGNSQTSTNFRYGTSGDTYSIFAIAMAVDAYIPDTDGEISAVTINGQPAGAGPYNALPGQDLEYKIKIRNRGTEAINNFKVTVPVPYNTTYVNGSATRQIFFTPASTPNTVTYNPAVGANGSVIWDLGTLPLPTAGPDQLLGELTFKFKVTTDCTLLKNTNCNNAVAVNGVISGTGAITGITLVNKDLIQGYTNSGSCQGVEIAAPIVVNVNAQDYVNQNCQSVPPITAFFICNSGTTIPITAVTGAFPPGSTFWGSYPVVSGQTVQYTINTPFPSTLGTSTYYAIPPGVLNGCYFQFTITVTTITSQPTVAPVNYCQGATASALTATPSAPGLTLYYYDSLNGVAQTSITPSTANIGQTTYYVAEGQSLTCIGPKRAIVVNVYAIPTVPVLGTVTQPSCSVATGSVALSGLPLGNWTITQTGTVNNSYSGTGATYLVPNLAAGSYTFTVGANNCTSEATTSVTINPQPSTPVVPVSGGNQTVCEANPIQTLTAAATAGNGETVVWYSASTGGTIVANPTLNTVGTVTYYAQANNAAGCVSAARVAVVLTINAAPVAPTATGGGNQTVCEASPIQTLTATASAPAGSTVVWYTAANGGTVVANPILNTVGTVTYYAQANNSTSDCASLTRTAVTLTINPAPTAPTVTAGNITECEQSPIQTLTATGTAPAGSTIVWYNAASGGQVVANPVLNSVGTVTYYAQANNSTSTCTSLTRTPVVLTINPAASAPVSGGNQTVCEASPIQTLTATATAPAGQTVVWYTAATGGTIVANPILNTVGTVTYYAQANNNTSSCTSLTRTPVILTITNAPVSPVSGGDQTVCQANPIQTLTATATAPGGASIVWYTAANGGSVVANPILNTVGTVTYYAQASGGSCSSLARTAVTLTINAAPVAPTVSAPNQTVCEASPIQTLTATATAPAGSTVVWYDAATGGNVITNPILNTVGTVTYYAQANVTDSACSSLTRTAATLTINAAPVAPTVTTSNITECAQSPIQTLTATATAPAGSTVVWYTAANGGSVVANPILNTVGTVTYYAQANATASSCGSLTRTPMTLTINATPAAPTVTAANITECEQSPIQTLTATATASAGQTIVWYTAATGGSVVANPILNTVGTVTYWAQANADASACSSLTRTSVTLTINATPAAPTVTATNITECQQSPIQTLTATATAPAGSTVVWYTAATGGTVVANPILNTVGSVTYYAQANASASSCTSFTRTAVTLTINAAPTAPTVTASNITECEQSPIQTLTATATAPAGATVVWYDAATDGNIVANPILNSVGTVTYYAQANTSATTCTSLARTAVTLTINAAPTAPTVTASNITECQQSPIQTLTATATAPAGSTVVWYTAATGGTVVANPILNTVGTVTYWAQANTSATTCTSLTRTSVTLTINAAPTAPTVTASNITECEQSPIQTLTATATAPANSTVVWYTAATGGTVVANPILNTVGTVTYWAQATGETCSSLTRTSVTLTINAAPAAPTVQAANITECEQSPIQTLTATATAPAGATVVWYNALIGGSVVANPILNTVGTVTYYAQANFGNTTCTSLTRTAVTLTITNAPVSPLSGGDQTECEQSPIQTLTATASAAGGQSIVWYTAATGGTVVANPILNTVGTVTYYAQATGGSCSSLTRTAVTLTINPAAAAPTVQAANITECEQSPIQTLTATATAPAGATVVWYNAETGGDIVANPILNTVGTVTYWAQGVVNNTDCTSLTRTSVTLTINPAADAPTVQAANITECEQSPIQTLTATATAAAGASVVWYTAATGGTVVANPILNTVGTVTYWAQANVDNTSCASLTRTSVTLTINPAAVAPTVQAANITECEQSPIQTLTATATAPAGATVVWYNAATGGDIVNNPILNTVGTVTYWAQANVDNTSCASLTRTSVTLTINPAAVAPTVQAANITECEQSPIQTLTATATAPAGATVVWYNAATGGDIVNNPILNTVGTVTYWAQANVDNTTCSSLTRTSVTLTINPAAEAPTVQAANITECEQSPIQTLTATATAPAGATVVWYNAATGGDVVANPILNTVGTVTYWAQANVDNTTCASLTRTSVTLTINAAPEAPSVQAANITECEASPIQTLTATATAPAGVTIVWYNAATGGDIVANPILNTVGTVTYYAQANVDNTTCSSLTRTAVTLTITNAPEVPVTGGDQTECEQSPIQTLTATATVPTGLTITWYDAATGGAVVQNPILNTVGTVTYYAEANGGTCTSLTRTAVTLTINPAAEAPTVQAANITECEQSPIQTLTATATAPAGATIVWYNAATGGDIVTNPILNTVGTVTYWAQANVDATTCSSLTRTSVTLTINPAAEAPTVQAANITECEQSPIQTLTATATAPAGTTVVWYNAATGGDVVTNPILNTVGTVTYWAQANVDATTCSSLTRTSVTLTINPAAEAPTVQAANITECEQSPIQTLTATATAPAGATVVWYNAETGGDVVDNPILNTVGTVTYWAQANVDATTCSSLTRTSVTLTINPAAEAPTVQAANITECEQSPIQTLTATATAPAGATVVWYNAETGGDIVTNPILNTVGTVTYWAQANVDATTCSSLTRTSVTLTINPAAEAPTVQAANITECEQSPIQTLTATATAPAGATVVWYNAETGGDIVTNPILNTVGTVTYWAQANVDATTCSSLTRTSVTLTINPAAEAPTVQATNITECEQSPIQTLTATATAPAGATIVWYNAATGGDVVDNPILNTVGTVTYWAQANVDATTCSSLTRTSVTLTITTAPEVPVTGGDQTECEQSPIQTLTATATVPAGFTVVWYNAANGGDVVTAPTLNTVGTVTYYAEANGGTCISLTRTAVTLTINPAAAAPTVEAANITECEQSPIQTLTATATAPAGATVVWYNAETGGDIVTNPILNTVGTVTYWAQANVDATACSSLTRTSVTLTINPAAAAPTVETANITECEQSPIQTLTATATAPAGATVVWYNAATGGDIVANPILNTVGTVTYWAQANVDGTSCASLTRTSVTLTINPASAAPTVEAANITECAQSPIQTLTATATAPAGSTVVWYNAATGGDVVTNPILNTVGTVTYWAQANNDATACSSLTRTSVTLTINESPAAPISGGNITECALNTIQTLTATATVPAGQTITWYSAATGGNLVTNPTLNTVGTVTYYAEATLGTCTSLTRTAVTLTINAAPSAPSILDATGECSVTVTPPSLTDNCGVQLTAVPNPNVLTYNEQGTYLIVWNFVDANGNVIVSANQNVIVDDVTAPNVPTLANLTGECSVTATPPTALDNCAGQITASTSDPLTYTQQGTYVINWTFNDGNGNSITVPQTVIVDDVTAPVTPVLADVTGVCSVALTPPTTTDNCNLNPITGTTDDPTQYNVVGNYTVTWKFDDGNGNTTTATQNVTVTAVGAIQTTSADASCNTDVDGIFNLNTYLANLGVPLGGTWADTNNTGALSGTNNATFTVLNVPVGDYLFTYTVQDGDCLTTVELTMTVDDECGEEPVGECDPVVHNAMSPNNDGQNDFFIIENFGEECITANSVEIYNRWGILVFESNMYDNNTRVFKGYSEGRTTVGSEDLPTGTYFYILNWTSGGKEKHKEGYLYLSR